MVLVFVLGKLGCVGVVVTVLLGWAFCREGLKLAEACRLQMDTFEVALGIPKSGKSVEAVKK